MAVKLERRHMTSSEDEPGTSYVQLDFDTQDEASTSTPWTWSSTTDDFTISASGFYLITTTIQCVVDGGSSWLAARITKNDTTVLTTNQARSGEGYGFQFYTGGSGDSEPMTLTAVAELADTDTIEVSFRMSGVAGGSVEGGVISIAEFGG